MNKILVCCFLLAVYCFSSCSSGKKEVVDERQNLLLHIDTLEKQMVNASSMELNKNIASQGITAYEEFAKKFPSDTISPEYLFRASDLSRALGDNAKSLDLLKKICSAYPNYRKTPDCIFLQGYYRQELFGDTAGARTFYNELIAKFPNHPFAGDAKAMIGMFGKTDEQVMREFEQKNAAPKKK